MKDMNDMNDVIAFLTMNGFKNTSINSLSNGVCFVILHEDHYSVTGFFDGKEDSTMYSKDLNIYWLIGVLTYYGFIRGDYKTK